MILPSDLSYDKPTGGMLLFLPTLYLKVLET